MKSILLMLVYVVVVYSLKTNQKKIPNGEIVRNPCDNTIWKGVGHRNPNGGGLLNLFGEDFRHVGGRHWTKNLCEKDSDGDGKSNGAELGDPSCIWSSSGSHNLQPVTGHPGICEPVGSPACSHQNFNCHTLFGKHHHG